jgi:hypothetical protein
MIWQVIVREKIVTFYCSKVTKPRAKELVFFWALIGRSFTVTLFKPIASKSKSWSPRKYLHELVLLGKHKLKWCMLHFSMSFLFELWSAEHLRSARDYWVFCKHISFKMKMITIIFTTMIFFPHIICNAHSQRWAISKSRVKNFVFL